MKIINTVVFSLIFILIYGQDFSKVLGVPDKFNRPVDLSNTEMESYVQGDSGPKSKNRPWRVICDRSGYETYSDASGNAKSGKKIRI
ncbi:MAG: hypothetical protein IPN46_16375 [Saprospiraceae bacterium]|nr:hypothetical protein [Saprospiraceae bacterium]